MNTQDLVTETPTPLEEIKQVDRPHFDVPIMIEITQWDLDNAKDFIDCENCLIGTALRRSGYSQFAVNGFGVTFLDGERNPVHFSCDKISHAYLIDRTNDRYKPQLLGRQIILYPENT